jgi:murein hydrolase activator
MFAVAALIIALALSLWPPAGRGQVEEERELARVREQIEALTTRIGRDTAARDEQAAALEALDRRLATTTRALAETRERVDAERRRETELAAETAAADARLAAERAALAEQVRLSYMTGRQEFFKLLLSQESPARLGRMIVYYDYLNRARSARIAAVAVELETLSRLAAETDAVRRELAALEAEQREQLDALEAARAERRARIAELDHSIAAGGTEVERLEAEEERLAKLVVELAELLSGFPDGEGQPFAELRGQLSWPVPGRITADYGRLRGGGSMRWNGVMLEAERGAVVRAVYHGRVAYSDWLPGLGMLVILDHGDGYMSLYGHNDRLLREAGDWVNPGDGIAEVGDSGGRSQPSLYFEIRRDGEPVDPHQWVSADAAGRP